MALSGKPCTGFGYKANRVRDNIHSFDVVHAFVEFKCNPRPGEVYNLGGCRANSISMLETIPRIETLTSRKIKCTYSEQARKGVHICYISKLGKLRSRYPACGVTRNRTGILDGMIAAAQHHAWGIGGI